MAVTRVRPCACGGSWLPQGLAVPGQAAPGMSFRQLPCSSQSSQAPEELGIIPLVTRMA